MYNIAKVGEYKVLNGHKVKRIVVKVGTSTLTHGTGMLNLRRIENLAKILADIKNSGVDVVLVTSGAIGVGMSKLGMTVRPTEVRYKQAAAAAFYREVSGTERIGY